MRPERSGGDTRRSRPGRGAAPQHGLHAQGKLPGAERLGHIVVGASLQPQHPVALFAERGEHDHRQQGLLTPDVPEPTADLETVDAGHHHVEHDEIRPPRAGQPQRGMPVGRVPGLHARMPEVVAHDLGDRRIVVDHENTRAHRSSVGRRSSSSRKDALPAARPGVLVASLL